MSTGQELAVAALAGYALGAVSPAVLVARAKGVDLRTVGSGNPGASNAGRALGRRTGVVVAVLDLAKGAVPALVAGAVAGHDAALLAGFCATLGHITSPLLRGRGGKGVATAAGAVLGAHAGWFPAVLLVWAATLGLTRWIALASVCAAGAVPVLAIVTGQDFFWALALAALVVVRHRANLQRGRPRR